MRIPAKYQSLLDDDQDTEERVRKVRGRVGAYRSSDPAVRRQVRLDWRAETGKTRRNARSIKVELQCPEGLAELFDIAYGEYRDRAAAEGRTVTKRGFISTVNLHRITVNYLRHNRTVYDQTLVRPSYSRNDQAGAYNSELKLKCLEAIAEKYPVLADECDRQARKAGTGLAQAAETIPGLAA